MIPIPIYKNRIKYNLQNKVENFQSIIQFSKDYAWHSVSNLLYSKARGIDFKHCHELGFMGFFGIII